MREHHQGARHPIINGENVELAKERERRKKERKKESYKLDWFHPPPHLGEIKDNHKIARIATGAKMSIIN